MSSRCPRVTITMYADSGTLRRSRGRFEVVGDDVAGVGKALAIGVTLAVVDYDDVEAGDTGNIVEVESDVSRAEDVQQRRRQYRLDEHVERAAADQAGVVLGIVVEVEGEGTRLFRFHYFARRLPDLGFDAAAADGADDRSVIAHQHLRGLEGGNRAAHVGDGGDGAAASFAAKLDDLLVDVHEGLPTIIDAAPARKGNCLRFVLTGHLGKS